MPSKHHRTGIFFLMVYCFLCFVAGCGGGSSSDTANSDIMDVVPLENGFLIPTSSNLKHLDVKDDTAYIIEEDGTLQIIDIVDPERPVLLDSLPGNAEADLAVGSGFLYVLGSRQLSYYNVTDPAFIDLKGQVELTGNANISSILYDAGRVFLLREFHSNTGSAGDGPPSSSFYLFDERLQTVTTSYAVSQFLWVAPMKILGVEHDRVYAQAYRHICILDVSDPADILGSEFEVQGSPDPLAVNITANTAYVIGQTGSASDPLDLTISDIDPSSDTYNRIIGYLRFSGRKDRGVSVLAKSLVVREGFAYVALMAGELLIFDVSDPAYPELMETVDFETVDTVSGFRENYDMVIMEDKTIIGHPKGLVIVESTP